MCYTYILAMYYYIHYISWYPYNTPRIPQGGVEHASWPHTSYLLPYMPVTHYPAPTYPTGGAGCVTISYIETLHTAYIQNHDHEVGGGGWVAGLGHIIYIYIYVLVGGLEHFLFFHNTWDNPSHWLIFFNMFKTTNQIYIHIYIYINLSIQICHNPQAQVKYRPGRSGHWLIGLTLCGHST